MNKTKIAFCGIVVGLSILFMFLTGVFPFLDYTLPAVSGILLILILLEVGKKASVIAYVAVSILSLFITPIKESAILFISFFGYYPILKSIFEKSKGRIIEWTYKILIANLGLLIWFGITYYIFNIKDILDSFYQYKYFSVVVIIMVLLYNLIFIVYDVAVSRIIYSYISWFKPKYLKHIK